MTMQSTTNSEEIAAALEQIESFIFDERGVADCALLAKKTTFGQLEIVAYVVSKDPEITSRLDASLKKSLPELKTPIRFVDVNAIPYTAQGKQDDVALAKLAVVDSDLARRWEERLRELPDVEEVAVMFQDRRELQATLPLAELLPDWQPRAKPVMRPAARAQSRERKKARKKRLAISLGAPFIADPDQPLTLPDALRRAATRSETNGLIYIQADGSNQVQSYRQLIDDAERILNGMRSAGVRSKDKVLLLLSRNDDFIPAFWACLLGGFVAVPIETAASYEQRNSARNKLEQTWLHLNRPV